MIFDTFVMFSLLFSEMWSFYHMISGYICDGCERREMWTFRHMIFGHIYDDVDDLWTHLCDDQPGYAKRGRFCHIIFIWHVCDD